MTDQAPLTAVLRTAARNSDRLLTAALAHLDLSGPRLELLAAYAERPGSSNSEAARTCDLSEQTAHTATARGKDILGQAQEAVADVEKRLATLLGADAASRLNGAVSALEPHLPKRTH